MTAILGSPQRGHRSANAELISTLVPGLADLHKRTLGNSQIAVAIIDGPINADHGCLRNAALRVLPDLASTGCPHGQSPACDHGTRVSGILFGQHLDASTFRGVAPNCTGLIIPVFSDGTRGGSRVAAVSQEYLARAIYIAIENGAAIINISGGQLSEEHTAWPKLRAAVDECNRRGVLIVAAAGNDGCACTHVPAALPQVVVVGAADNDGRPLAESNYGHAYRESGLLAPGQSIPCPDSSGQIKPATGSSFATPIVSGVAALFLSLIVGNGRWGKSDVDRVRSALLQGATPCPYKSPTACARYLSGVLNVPNSLSLLTKGAFQVAVSEQVNELARVRSPGIEPQGSGSDNDTPPDAMFEPPLEKSALNSALTKRDHAPRFDRQHFDAVTPSCGGKESCSCETREPRLVYALGQIGYDLISQARYDAIDYEMPENEHPNDARQLVKFLKHHPHFASSICWTLNMDGTPFYALAPVGPFANETYRAIVAFFDEQVSENVERLSIPGVVTASIELMNGQVVPVIAPELRGMCNWTTKALIDFVLKGTKKEDADGRKRLLIESFLARVYHELRNFGRQPQERAINFAATNAFQIQHTATRQTIFEDAAKAEMELDTIDVERSPICRPESDCWDVKLGFYRVEDALQRPRRVYRFTVDVSDSVPVLVGPMRTWSER